MHEQEAFDAFQKLREETHHEMEKAVMDRETKNPQPEEIELVIGRFLEDIEPQVRDAVVEMVRKGYATASSGFGGNFGQKQVIDGNFSIDEQTRKTLGEFGVQVKGWADYGMPYDDARYTFIEFSPTAPDIKAMKDTWDRVAAVLPDLGHIAPPSVTGGSQEFRKRFAPERTDIEGIVIERMLEIGDLEPTYEQKIRLRLAEIRKDRPERTS